MLVPIENLANIGVVYDRRTYELPPEAWSAIRNARFRHGEVTRFPGYIEVYSETTPSHSLAPMWLLPWSDVLNFYWIYTTQTKAYRMTSSVLTDITNAGGNYGAGADDRWTGGILGGVPILNNNSGSDYPQQWDGGTSKLIDLTAWPANHYCKAIRVHKQFLVALNITDSGTSQNFPHMVKWSNAAAPGTVPTSWDETDDTVDSGEVDLAETTGHCVDCLTLGDVNVVYKEDSTWGMQYVGGQSIFRFFPIFLEQGIYAIGCVGTFDRKHFVLTRDDVIVHDMRSWQSVIDGRNKRWLLSQINEDAYEKTYVAMDPREQEAHICFVSAGNNSSNAPDVDFVWNWKYNTWSQREIPGYGHIAYGVVDFESLDDEIWDNDTQVWDSDTQNWDWRSYSPAKNRLMAAATDDTEFHLLNEGNANATAAYEFKIQRTGLPVAGRDREGKLKIDLNSVKLVRRVFIKVDTPLDFQVRIGMQNDPGGAVSWTPEYTFSSGDIFVDVMLSGRFLCYEFSQTEEVPFILTGITVDMDIITEATF